MIENFLNVSIKEQMVKKITILQNEISIVYDTKVIAISSFGDDKLAAAFAKGMADVYAVNDSNALVIDANLYNPCLKDLLNGQSAEGIQKLGEKNGVAYLDKEIYPSTVYKSGAIQKLIEDGLKEYEHILVIVPSIIEHQEIALLSKEINSAVLVARQNVTKKGQIFNALQFCAEANIPVSKTVILK